MRQATTPFMSATIFCRRLKMRYYNGLAMRAGFWSQPTLILVRFWHCASRAIRQWCCSAVRHSAARKSSQRYYSRTYLNFLKRLSRAVLLCWTNNEFGFVSFPSIVGNSLPVCIFGRDDGNGPRCLPLTRHQIGAVGLLRGQKATRGSAGQSARSGLCEGGR